MTPKSRGEGGEGFSRARQAASSDGGVGAVGGRQCGWGRRCPLQRWPGARGRLMLQDPSVRWQLGTMHGPHGPYRVS